MTWDIIGVILNIIMIIYNIKHKYTWAWIFNMLAIVAFTTSIILKLVIKY
jgi:hypothetical protein